MSFLVRDAGPRDVDGAVCGYLLSVVRQQADNPFVVDRTWLELDQICVDPRHRRHGLARALIASAIAHADAQRITDIELSTWAFNEDAQRSFRELGFVPKVVRFEAKGRARSLETSRP